MTIAPPTRIVVGVDGSPGSAEALRWAAEEAELHGATLTAVMAWGLLDQHPSTASRSTRTSTRPRPAPGSASTSSRRCRNKVLASRRRCDPLGAHRSSFT